MRLYSAVLFLVLSCFSCNKKVLTSTDSDHKKAGEQQGSYSKLSDNQLLDLVQKQTIKYFWEGAEPNSGMACERVHMDGFYPQNDQHIITTGGSGFGFMAILAGVERGFIKKEEALDRFLKNIAFLEKADRFHGVWPHWLDGKTGKVQPFSKKDDGGDLVETAFMVQGLLAVAEYFNGTNPKEKLLVSKIDTLWRGIEWNWYTQGKNILYWHWSPNYGWEMNFPVGGYNECLIMYVLAAASPTFPISKEVYEQGWALYGNIKKDTTLYGIKTVLNHYEHSKAPVGPLFWAHYSYLGLDPNGLIDQFADYGLLNRNHALIHHQHAIKNPNKCKGYSAVNWGLTSSYSMKGYAGHQPYKDLCVISPTAAMSSIPYTPKESLDFIRHLYIDKMEYIGEYGPYDAFSEEHNWYLPRYLALDQGPIPVMIENYRSGLLWKLFMANNDVKIGLKRLGFMYAK